LKGFEQKVGKITAITKCHPFVTFSQQAIHSSVF